MLWAACATIGSACLGFKPSKIGTHSLHLGAAMEMYLSGLPVYTIMLICRWSSNAFLSYIQKQVKLFSTDFAKKMLMHRSFWMIPDVPPCKVLYDDSRQRNHWDNVKTRKNIGHNMSWQVQLPAFSFFNWSINNAEQLVEEASSHWLLKASGEGRVEINFRFQTQPPPVHILCTFLEFMYHGGIWLWSCIVDWMLTEERERAGTGRPNKLNWAKYLKLQRGKNWDWGLISNLAFQLHQDKQPVHVIELESSSKNPQNHHEGSSHQSMKASGEWRVEIKFHFQIQPPPSAHLVHFFLIYISWRQLASKLVCNMKDPTGIWGQIILQCKDANVMASKLV